jgi:hypothetical protein
MTQAEVEALLGGPPGMYGLHGDAVPMGGQLTDREGRLIKTSRHWTGENRSIGVCFIDGRVCESPQVIWMPAPPIEQVVYWGLYPIKFWLRDFWANGR